MAILPGSRLGPYEILSAIGAGGMGEVYKAHDSKPARDVAIKVLPANFAKPMPETLVNLLSSSGSFVGKRWIESIAYAIRKFRCS